MNTMQKHAYLIMAHNNFEQLGLLIQVLDNPRTDLFIHIDAKTDFTDYKRLQNAACYSSVHVYKKYKIYWADYSQTQCELFLFEKALEYGPFEYYHLISNADFPTMSQEKILSFFDSNKGKEFISFRFPMNAWPFRNKPYTTEIKYYHILSKYYRTNNKVINRFVYFIEYSCVFIQFLLRINRIHGQYIPAKGSNWISVTESFAKYIIDNKKFIERNFNHTRSSEEVFPAILAYNNEHFRENLYDKKCDSSNNANQRYIDWKRGFPYTFKVEDYDEIVSSGFPFVRKVDMRSDGGLVKKLYDKIMAESRDLK